MTSCGRTPRTCSPGASRPWPSAIRAPPAVSDVSLRAVAANLRGDHVDRRIADELGHETMHRATVDIVGRRHLHNLAVPHHGDAVRHAHRLHLIVRHVEDGLAERCWISLQLAAQSGADRRIQVRHRLVEQQKLWLRHQHAGERDPLHLAHIEAAAAPIEDRPQVEPIVPIPSRRARVSARGSFFTSSPKARLSRTLSCVNTA